jgi:hypothetical protein
MGVAQDMDKWRALVSNSGYEQVESSYDCGNEPSSSIKCWETVKRLHNWWPFM